VGAGVAAHPLAPAGEALLQGGAREGQHRHRDLVEAAAELHQEGEGRIVSPVGVLEQDTDRPPCGTQLQPTARLGEQRRAVRHVVGRRGLQPLGVRRAEQGERCHLAERRRPPHQPVHLAPLTEGAGELGAEPALALAGGSEDRRERGRARLPHAPDERDEARELGVPAHEGGGGLDAGPGGGARSRLDAEGALPGVVRHLAHTEAAYEVSGCGR